MVIISIVSLAIFALEPIVRLSHDSKISKYISDGRYVPPWKRFPIFFVAVIIVFAIEQVMEKGLDRYLSNESINLIFIIFWLISLFSLYYLLFFGLPAHRRKSVQMNRKRRIEK